MNEKLLHFIWKFQLFDKGNLLTTAGDIVEVVYPGLHNTDAGADFQQAKIRIGNTLWAGNIEMHVRSSDWFLHRHQTDKAYNNVILHIVFEADSRVALRENGEEIPMLVLQDRVNSATLLRYSELEKSKQWIPCSKFFAEQDAFIRDTFGQRLLTERLENKVESINELLEQNDNDWENVLFQMLAQYMGAPINKDPFLLLAKSLAVNVWSKYCGNLMQLEALLFGQAGFLQHSFDDEYPNRLRKEYLYLKKLHNLQPLEKHIWKFLRLRPSNFPTVRIAQLAALINTESKMFSKMAEANSVEMIQQFFSAEISEYWRTHYNFDKPAKQHSAQIGSSMANVLFINAIAPVLFAYGRYKDKEDLCTKAISFLENSKPEVNAVTNNWAKLNWKAENAFQSQAMLQLKNEYCSKFRCVECAIGAAILR